MVRMISSLSHKFFTHYSSELFFAGLPLLTYFGCLVSNPTSDSVKESNSFLSGNS